MVIKQIISILLLSGGLQVLAADNTDKSSELNHEFHDGQVQQFTNKEKKFRDASLQFEKDYYRWDEKKNAKHDYKEFKDSADYIKLNEIESHEYVDKYNKYGKTFNPKLARMQKDKAEFQKKRALENEKHYREHEKPQVLVDDLNVNYYNDKKGQFGNLVDDINVNYVNNYKEMPEDSEWISANAVPGSKENFKENYQNGNELYMKRYKKNFYQNINKIDLSNPPPPNDTVLMARYIVHTVDWAALGTLSGRSLTKGSPFVCVKATSDGVQNASSGIPFFYMSPMDLCTQDLQKDNRVSVLVTLSQTDYCKKQNYDPQDPRCAKLTLNGKIKTIKRGSDEEKFARNALFSRHPAMESWPADHDWYFTKLKIQQIILLDQFGGATYIKVKDYLNGKIVEPEVELRK